MASSFFGTSAASSSQSSSAPVDLQTLVDLSERLVDESEVPLKIHKNLDSIYFQSKKLGESIERVEKAPSAGAAMGITAAPAGELLLAEQGVKVERMRRLLKSVDLRPTQYEPLEPVALTDIQGYLKHEHKMIMLSAAEEARKLTSNQFYKHYEDYLDSEWKKSKQQLLQDLKFHRNALRGAAIAASASGAGSALLDQQQQLAASAGIRYVPQPEAPLGLEPMAVAAPGRRGRTNMDQRMQQYATVVYQLNQTQITGDFLPLILRFQQAAEQVADRETRKREIISAWEILRQVVGEDDMARRGVKSERKTHELIMGSLRYLYNHYVKYMQDALLHEQMSSNLLAGAGAALQQPQQPPLAGLPLINAFVDGIMRQNPRNDLDMQPDAGVLRPVWMQIFLCLRTGYLQEAKSLVSKLLRDDNTSAIMTLLDVMIQQKDNANFVVPQLGDALVKLQTAAMSTRPQDRDPFRRVVLLVLGRDQSPSYPKEVIRSHEDYMWYKLSTLDLSGIAGGNESRLEALRSEIVKLGPSFWSPKPGSLAYFKILLLVGEFAEAVYHLCTLDVDGYQVEGLHFAIALDYYDLLKLAPQDSPVFVPSAAGQPKLINFYYLLRSYVRIFAHTDPREAISYISIIRSREVRLSYLHDLVCTKGADVSVLAGNVDPQSCRVRRGALFEFSRKEKDAADLLRACAQTYEHIGKFSAAVDLYLIAMEVEVSSTAAQLMETVLTIVNKELSSIVADVSATGAQDQLGGSVASGGGATNTEEILLMARKVQACRLQQQAQQQQGLSSSSTLTKQWQTFSMLLRLRDFFGLFRAGKWYDALVVLDELQLVPLRTDSSLDYFVTRFTAELDELVRRKFSDIIFTCYLCLYNLYRDYSTKNDAQQARAMREAANALLTFCGYVQQYLPSDLYQRIVRIQF